MLSVLINILKDIGIYGLMIVIFIEGLAIPFPGSPILIFYGYYLNPELIELFIIALGMSFTYVIASFIPYLIGFKLGEKIKKRFKRKILKAQNWFHKYGDSSIALARPLGFGNYISYIAGISKTKIWKYILLTFFGIYPWSFAVLFLGKLYKGNVEAINDLLNKYQIFILIIILLGTITYIGTKSINL